MRLQRPYKLGRMKEMDDQPENIGQPKSMRKKIDRLLLGVVVGGAVGSILGVTLAPKSGKETRKMMGDRSRDTWNKISAIIEEQERRTTRKQKHGLWHLLNRIFVRKK